MAASIGVADYQTSFAQAEPAKKENGGATNVGKTCGEYTQIQESLLAGDKDAARGLKRSAEEALSSGSKSR